MRPPRLSIMSLTLLLVAAPAVAQEKAAAPTAGANSVATDAKHPKPKLMDINTASADELKTLPGITDELAKKIIAARPYSGKDQLWKQNILDKAAYEQIRPLVHAKQPKATGGQGAVESHSGPGPASDKHIAPQTPADPKK